MSEATSRNNRTFLICACGLMAALACVANYVSIPFFASRLHIGNAVCVLCGLLLGPSAGFWAAGIGNGLFDLIGGYGMEFIITFINKGLMALVTGLIAHRAARKASLTGADHARIIAGSVLGALTYSALYLIKSYITLRFVRGLSPQDVINVDGTIISGVNTLMAGKAVASLTNAAFAFIVAPLFYHALRPALRSFGMIEKE